MEFKWNYYIKALICKERDGTQRVEMINEDSVGEEIVLLLKERMTMVRQTASRISDIREADLGTVART